MFVFQELLTEIFFSLPQTGVFKNRFQNHFSPVTLCLGISLQRTCQVIGFVADLFVQLYQFFYLVFQRETLLRFLVVYLCHLMLELVQVFAEWLQQTGKAFGTQLVETFRFLLEYLVGDIFKFQVELFVEFCHFLFLMFKFLFERPLFGL